MSKTILSKLDGFTPLIDGIVSEHGIIRAAVFGRVWRYCQMPDGVCRASQEKIAGELGMTRGAINQHINALCKDGYLKDITPTLLGEPHVYIDTGKAGMSISLQGGVNENDRWCNPSLQGGVNENDRWCNPSLQGGVNENDRGCNPSLQGGVNENDTKKQVKKQEECPIIASMKKNNIKMTGTMTGSLIDNWKKEHTDEWILKAIAMSVGKHENYADRILAGWLINGYPKAADAHQKQSPITEPVYRDQPDPDDAQRMSAAEYKDWMAENAKRI